MPQQLSRPSLTLLSSAMIIFALGGCGGPGQPPAPPLPPLEKVTPLASADADFVQKLNDMDLTEIALAKLAATHAARNDIAALSVTLLKDHTTNQTTLAKIAAKHSLSLATAPSNEGQRIILRMSGVHGAAFDRDYLKYIKQNYRTLKPTLRERVKNSQDADVVSLAKDTESMFYEHESSF
ncbi:hypothetical protein AA23498_0483 [Acetobacter nitrogenifigens DSM 23921 = NBRC 105050]|uniref:DUF4142 domain-containing protein n=1 Tax=Acetobacter nitrogenifigens DSM 23921 = NBRC 105050 TaxID=1120919 RepID=A0A511XC21_9PROT|nr:DUF4142 domain-containing protein [Acetobacter nitrogenifigens]GBQ88867.1 hypothetical protein AA23498_0483 [Acetobacter nitrogenifigens DSM 23921 = NBRC 105050]GEN60513.1 hypothetical protein ANI02nite_23970 [Acetobacter nitrogenifigens DSM 23921 = NBRC 105050]